MAVRNAKLGGTDWGSEVLKSEDLNDTFNSTIDEIDNKAVPKILAESYSAAETWDSSWSTERSYSYTGGTCKKKIIIFANCTSRTTVDGSTAGGSTTMVGIRILVDGSEKKKIEADAYYTKSGSGYYESADSHAIGMIMLVLDSNDIDLEQDHTITLQIHGGSAGSMDVEVRNDFWVILGW